MSELFSLDSFEDEVDFAKDDCNEHDGGNKLPAKRKHKHSLSTVTNVGMVDSQSSSQPPPNIAKPSPDQNLHLAARLSLLLQEQQSRNESLEQDNQKLRNSIKRMKAEKEALRCNISSYVETSAQYRASSSAEQTSATDSEALIPYHQSCLDIAKQLVKELSSTSSLVFEDCGELSNQTATEVAEILFNEEIVSGQLVHALMSKARQWLSNNDLHPITY
ncbi:hypothetical protein ACA910_007526 [Epithemia clementina (nom. ined.)]